MGRLSIPRMRTLGIIPSIQPTHATSDLGKERLVKCAYLMKSLSETGLRVVLGSDFPVESHDWRDGVYVAINLFSKEDTERAYYPGEAPSFRRVYQVLSVCSLGGETFGGYFGVQVGGLSRAKLGRRLERRERYVAIEGCADLGGRKES